MQSQARQELLRDAWLGSGQVPTLITLALGPPGGTLPGGATALCWLLEGDRRLTTGPSELAGNTGILLTGSPSCAPPRPRCMPSPVTRKSSPWRRGHGQPPCHALALGILRWQLCTGHTVLGAWGRELLSACRRGETEAQRGISSRVRAHAAVPRPVYFAATLQEMP